MQAETCISRFFISLKEHFCLISFLGWLFNIMPRYFLIFPMLLSWFLHGQTFYEKIMEMNIANADTSTDRAVLDMSAKAIERVSRGTGNNWEANFHMALCFVRMTDISLNLRDTIGAKIALEMSKTQLKKLDSGTVAETKILNYYHRINELRIGKADAKKIAALEIQLENFKSNESENPRIYLVNAYYYKCFFSKKKRTKALALTEQSQKLFILEKPTGYAPHWGKKWASELALELQEKKK